MKMLRVCVDELIFFSPLDGDCEKQVRPDK